MKCDIDIVFCFCSVLHIQPTRGFALFVVRSGEVSLIQCVQKHAKVDNEPVGGGAHFFTNLKLPEGLLYCIFFCLKACLISAEANEKISGRTRIQISAAIADHHQRLIAKSNLGA
jgi:hypothetical protein